MMTDAAPPADSRFLELDGQTIEYRYAPGSMPDAPTLVFLHQGLGSVSAWRDVPLLLAARTGCSAFWYSRRGYGWSSPVSEARRPDYMQAEAGIVLPRLLRHLGLNDIILVGHSDGGTIALSYLGLGFPARAAIAVAPHVRDERITHETIAIQREQWYSAPLRQRLQRHHRNADNMFLSWTDIWLSSQFRGWSMEALLPAITAPVLGLQGYQDETGSMIHIDTTASQVAGPAELVKFEQCRHDPFREYPDRTLDACADFLRRHAGTPR